MAVSSGRIVITRGAEKPYKVILEHEPSGTSEHPVSTIAEGEALIRQRIKPAAPAPQMPEWHI